MFGHTDCPDNIISKIEVAIVEQHLRQGVDIFYVGNRGRFDSLAATAMNRVKQFHPNLKLYLVLAYHPEGRVVDLSDRFDNSYYPPLENVPRKYAIVRANRYMVDTADSIICYVKHIGNTRNLLEYAQRRQKKEGIIIENVAENS
jgi:hypothetical protein